MAEPTRNVKELVAERLLRFRDQVATAAAAQLGPPPLSRRASSAELVALWNRRGPGWEDPSQDEAKWVQGLQEGLAAGQKAEDVLRDLLDKQHPERRRVVTLGRPDLEDQCREAKRLAKLAVDAVMAEPIPAMDAESEVM